MIQEHTYFSVITFNDDGGGGHITIYIYLLHHHGRRSSRDEEVMERVRMRMRRAKVQGRVLHWKTQRLKGALNRISGIGGGATRRHDVDG